MHFTYLRLGLLPFVIFTLGSLFGCPETEPLKEQILKSNGVFIQDGKAKDYTIDQEKSSFVIEIQRDGGACTVFHAHVVQATQIGASFKLDLDKPENSNLKFKVAAIGLVNDTPELRAQYASTRDQEVSDSDRESIKAGILEEQLNASEFPILEFAIPKFNKILGEDLSVSSAALIKGQESTLTMVYTAKLEGDLIKITGEGILDGSQHGMPSGFGSSCVKVMMPLHLKLTLKPGIITNEGDAGTIEKYEEKGFPYEGECHETLGYNIVEPILLENCASCHLDTPILGASVALTSYEHWRVDSLRNQDSPLYLTAKHLMENMDSNSLTMPPKSTTPLNETNKQTILDWIDAGAPPQSCDNTAWEYPTGQDKSACGSPNYDDDIKSKIRANCLACHDGSQNNVPLLNSYSSGLQMARNPYFKNYTLWELAAHRVVNKSMPPFGSYGSYLPAQGHTEFEEFESFRSWIIAGYPEKSCN